MMEGLWMGWAFFIFSPVMLVFAIFEKKENLPLLKRVGSIAFSIGTFALSIACMTSEMRGYMYYSIYAFGEVIGIITNYIIGLIFNH